MLISPESLAIVGGAIALAGGLAGSSIGIGIAGSAGAATLSEEPGQLRNVILLASLPMTQTFYGLITLILVLTTVLPRLGTMTDGGGMGLAVLGIGILAGAAEAFAVFVELIGVFGLVFAIMSFALLGLFG